MLVVLLLTLFTACSKDDEKPANAYAKIKGTWQIDEVIVIGDVKKGDGSTMTFDQCDNPPCNGKLYNASKKTSDDFMYAFVNDNSRLEISGLQPGELGLNTTWLIDAFDSDYLRLKGDNGFWVNYKVKLTR